MMLVDRARAASNFSSTVPTGRHGGARGGAGGARAPGRGRAAAASGGAALRLLRPRALEVPLPRLRPPHLLQRLCRRAQGGDGLHLGSAGGSQRRGCLWEVAGCPGAQERDGGWRRGSQGMGHGQGVRSVDRH